jgi:alpha,alpha-trehalase
LFQIRRMRIQQALRVSEILPNPFIPASDGFFKEQFYWDSFFIFQGLKHKGKAGREMAIGMVENFFHLLERYGYIPNSQTNFDRSQPPFLSSMVRDVYAMKKDQEWLRRAYARVSFEYKDFWTCKPRLCHRGLSRYYNASEIHNIDRDMAYGAMQESGWDNTLRFGGDSRDSYVSGSRMHQCLPVDLNSLLYKYETDLAWMAGILGNRTDKADWERLARERKDEINSLMWDGFYYDYDFDRGKIMLSKTLAAFFPLWTGLADKPMAKALRESLFLFEYEDGIAATEKALGHESLQWGYPNAWAPLQWIAARGLERYGYRKDAERIKKKFLSAIKKEKGYPEKISADRKAKRIDDPRYPHQKNSFWTWGVVTDFSADRQ